MQVVTFVSGICLVYHQMKYERLLSNNSCSSHKEMPILLSESPGYSTVRLALMTFDHICKNLSGCCHATGVVQTMSADRFCIHLTIAGVLDV